MHDSNAPKDFDGPQLHQDPEDDGFARFLRAELKSSLPTTVFDEAGLWERLSQRRRARVFRPFHPYLAAAAVLLVAGGFWLFQKSPSVQERAGVSATRVANEATVFAALPEPTPASVRGFRRLAAYHVTEAGEFVSNRLQGVATNADRSRAERLLTSTRVLLDSPASADSATRSLLSDLELLLMDISYANARLAQSDDRRSLWRERSMGGRIRSVSALLLPSAS